VAPTAAAKKRYSKTKKSRVERQKLVEQEEALVENLAALLNEPATPNSNSNSNNCNSSSSNKSNNKQCCNA